MIGYLGNLSPLGADPDVPNEAEEDMCVVCGLKPVTWPRVCNDCQDKEAQAELALRYDRMGITPGAMTCRTCGMIYDGGQCCTYCGDTNPEDDDEDPDW